MSSVIKDTNVSNLTHRARLGTAPVPLDCYRSQKFYELERDRVFGRAWLLMGRIEEIPESGDFMLKEVPPFQLSVIITRAKDGRIRAFHNSCSHRGSQVVQARRGNAGRFLCPYHNWSYANDGRLLGIPDGQNFFNVDKAACGLTKVACEIWEGWIFINLQRVPEVSLLTFLGPIADHLRGLTYLAADNPVVITADLDANWKVVSDAFIETYHIPVIHPSTIGATFSSGENPFAHLLDARVFGAHRTISEYGNPKFAPAETDKVQRLAQSGAKTGSTIAAATVENAAVFLEHPAVNPTRSSTWAMDVNHIFPHTQLDCGPGGFWTHQFWPTSRNTCHYEVRFYVPRAADVRERFQQELYVSRVIEVVLEDLVNVARTQRGIDSGAKDFMQLQDNEVAIRHSVEQIIKWVEADSVAQALEP